MVYNQDIDGFGDPNNSVVACLQPAGFLADNRDCNDQDDTVYFGAPEFCDGQDNACSGALLPAETDDDQDGYVECIIDANGWDGNPTVVGGEDCNDDPNNGGAAIKPGATEGLNDGIDQDCDVLELCPVDADNDLFGILLLEQV